MIMFIANLLLLVHSSQQQRRFNEKYYNEKFECFFDKAGVYSEHFGYAKNANPAPEVCCGKMANGLRQCDLASKWRKVGDSDFSLCEGQFGRALSEGRDLCCQNSYFNNCDVCKSFMVWPYYNFNDEQGANGLDSPKRDNKGMRTVVMNDTTWEDKYDNQEPPANAPDLAYTNEYHPIGFVNARLAEFNAPPVCVFVPTAGGRVIEIRVESDTPGNKVCVDDLQDDSLANKNNPGITQSCDDSRLKTCFPDGAVGLNAANERVGFAFLITCQDSCEARDIDLWLRVRASDTTWEQGSEAAETNVEMWCQWGISGEQFSKWDRFPSDLTPPKDPKIFPSDSGVAKFSTLSILLALSMYL